VAKVWILSPTRKNAYVPMFKGTLEEAVREANALALRHKSRVLIFDATKSGRGPGMEFVMNVDPAAAALSGRGEAKKEESLYLVHLDHDGRRDVKYTKAVDPEDAAAKASRGWRYGARVTRDRSGHDLYGDYERFILREGQFVAMVQVYSPATKS